MKIFIAAFLLLVGTMTQAQTQDNFVGNWSTNDGYTLEIYIHDSSYYGKINNQVVLIQMAKKSDTQLYGGTYYDKELKTEYEVKLKLSDANTIRMKVLSGLSSKTILWHRNPVTRKGKAAEVGISQR